VPLVDVILAGIGLLLDGRFVVFTSKLPHTLQLRLDLAC